MKYTTAYLVEEFDRELPNFHSDMIIHDREKEVLIYKGIIDARVPKSKCDEEIAKFADMFKIDIHTPDPSLSKEEGLEEFLRSDDDMRIFKRYTANAPYAVELWMLKKVNDLEAKAVIDGLSVTAGFNPKLIRDLAVYKFMNQPGRYEQSRLGV